MPQNIGLILALVSLPILILIGNPALALITGMALTLWMNRRAVEIDDKYGKLLLQGAIVLLGFKLNVSDLWEISANYTLPVSAYVLSALTIGLVFAKLLRVEFKSALLMSSGTAICGGTTIATLSPIIKARSDQMGAALGIVFLLNALALFLFPYIGHYYDMSQEQFGVWVALAIHDTSSVVATAQIYGDEAATVATTVKLGRTLWLIPMVLITSLAVQSDETKMRLPLFIVFFILASVIGSMITLPAQALTGIAWVSKSMLVIALFLVGTEISRETLKSIQGRVLIHAIGLWGLVILVTLATILSWVK